MESGIGVDHDRDDEREGFGHPVAAGIRSGDFARSEGCALAIAQGEDRAKPVLRIGLDVPFDGHLGDCGRDEDGMPEASLDLTGKLLRCRARFGPWEAHPAERRGARRLWLSRHRALPP
jgi:hypothetical protein